MPNSSAHPSPKRPAIFLDRDGTLNVDVGYAHRVEDLLLLDNVCPGLRKFQSLGFALFITTNQSGIARGYFSEAQMHAFNAALCELLRGGGIEIAGIYYCPFHPTAGRGAFRSESPLRKPAPGMLLQAAAEHGLDLAASFAIGDKKSDLAAGRAAGCRTVLVHTGMAGAGESELTVCPDFVADDLLSAAQQIEAALPTPTGIPPLGDYAYPAGDFDGAVR